MIFYENQWVYKTTNHNSDIYYRYISQEEYNRKRRDKFNDIVLKTIMKCLINEDFEVLKF